MKIYTFMLKGHEIDLTYRNGNLAYTFKKDDGTYGIKTHIKSRAVMDVAASTFQLLTNALDTIEALHEDENK